MNLSGRIQLARDRSVTVANLLDELLRRKGDCEVSINEDGPYRLAKMHAMVCEIDGFFRRSIGLRPGEPVAIYRTNDRWCLQWFLAIIRAGGIAVPLNPLLSLAEVRRILADSGTEILVTDRAVFERTIIDRVRSMSARGFRVTKNPKHSMDLFAQVTTARRCLLPPSILRQR